MLSTKRLYRLGFAVLVGASILVSGTKKVFGGDGSINPDPVRVASKRLVATPRMIEPEREFVEAQDCPLGVAVRCFDAISSTALNPASFFDTNEVSDVTHYFMKQFRNDTDETLIVEGMGFEARADNPAFRRFQAAGAIYAGPDALFPSPEGLLALPVVEISGAAPGNLTCVEFPTSIDTRGVTIGLDTILNPGDTAWLVLRFIAAPPGEFVGILMDDDDTDQPCDYLTIDGGSTWYQPDPVHGPKLDWGITAFTSSGQGAPSPAAPTWSTVKKLYDSE